MSSSEAWAIENLQSLREAFRIFDRQDCGQVRRQDLEFAIKDLKIDINEEELDYIMQEVSHQSGKKQFDFDEFLLILVRKENFSYSAGKVIEAFKLLDESNDGKISRKALCEILKSISKDGEAGMDEEEIEGLVKGVLEKNEKSEKSEKSDKDDKIFKSQQSKIDKNDKGEKDDESLDYNNLVNTVMAMLQ